MYQILLHHTMEDTPTYALAPPVYLGVIFKYLLYNSRNDVSANITLRRDMMFFLTSHWCDINAPYLKSDLLFIDVSYIAQQPCIYMVYGQNGLKTKWPITHKTYKNLLKPIQTYQKPNLGT